MTSFVAKAAYRLVRRSRWADKIESCHILNETEDRFMCLSLSCLCYGTSRRLVRHDVRIDPSLNSNCRIDWVFPSVVVGLKLEHCKERQENSNKGADYHDSKPARRKEKPIAQSVNTCNQERNHLMASGRLRSAGQDWLPKEVIVPGCLRAWELRPVRNWGDVIGQRACCATTRRVEPRREQN